MPPNNVELELFRQMFQSIPEEMGAVLRKTAFSANIKERRDYSCASTTARGDTVAMGDHMPVHLGAMPLSVAGVLERFELGPGDVAIVNDPFAGGTHLPDITAVAGVLSGEREAGDVLCGDARAPRRRRRDEPGLDAVGHRDLSGRITHSADSARAWRGYG